MERTTPTSTPTEKSDAVTRLVPRRIVRTLPKPIQTPAAIKKQAAAKEVLEKTPTAQEVIAKKPAAKLRKSKAAPLPTEGQAVAKILLGMADPVDGIETMTELESQRVIQVGHKRKHAIWYQFRWSRDHFNGHVINMICEGRKRTQVIGEAVVSIYTVAEAKEFRKAYRLLIGLRANRRQERD
jgi:hypothetical protein